MTVYYKLDCVIFDASMVIRMTGWFETEFEIYIISLAILRKFSHSNFHVFYYCIGLEYIS